MSDIRVIGTGIGVPPLLTNENVMDLLPDLGITKEWLETNVGIKQRHISIEGMHGEESFVSSSDNINNNNNSNNSSSTTNKKKKTKKPFEKRTDLRAATGCATSDLCAKAITNATINANANYQQNNQNQQNKNTNYTNGKNSFTLDDIDMIIVSTVTPDQPCPATATFVMEKLGLNSKIVMDIRSACCGFTIALQTALAYLKSGQSNVKNIAVVGCEVGSVFGNLNPKHPAFHKGDVVNTAMIGDAAGCWIVKSDFSSEQDSAFGVEVLHVDSRCIGRDKEMGMYIPSGGSLRPFSQEVFNEGGCFFHHDFKKVLEHGAELYHAAITNGLDALKKNEISTTATSEKNNNNNKNSNSASSSSSSSKSFFSLPPSLVDVACYIPHQANGRITSYANKMGISSSQCHEHFSIFGNTANASLAIGLHLELEGVFSSKSFKERKGNSSSSSSLDEQQQQQNGAMLKDGDIIMCLAAESTKWLYGTILLKYRSMTIVPEASYRKVFEQQQDELFDNSTEEDKNVVFVCKSNNNSSSSSSTCLDNLDNVRTNNNFLLRLKSVIYFVVVSYIISSMKYIMGFINFFSSKKAKQQHNDKNDNNNNNKKQN